MDELTKNEIEEQKDLIEGKEDEESDVDVDEIIDENKLMAYDIAVFYNTYNLSTIMKWWGKKLIVPDFQRSYVWKVKQASEFVDSMLRGLPVPSLFFYDDTDNNRLLVVDGQQRLRSLYSFIVKKEFAGKPFKLVGNIHPKWKGKTYDTLDEEDRDRLDDSLMNITVMRQLAPDDGQSAMYLAFQRVNTGGISLKAQEIRMAVSYGPFAKYIYNLAKDPRFDKWSFLRTREQKNNNNYAPIEELLLKFFAYYFCYPKFSGSSTRVLLDEFFDVQKDFDNPKRRIPEKNYYSEAQFQEVFDATFSIVTSLPLETLSPYKTPTQTFIESVWVGLTHRILVQKKDFSQEKLGEYISNWKNVIGEERFSELFQARRTSSTKSAFERIEAGIVYFSGDIDA